MLLGLGLGLAGCASSGASSPERPLVSDRPDFTESASTVIPGRFQIEGGYTLTTGDAVTTHDVGELLVRAGIGPTVEARVGVGSYRWVDPSEGSATSALVATAAGFKLRLPGGGVADEVAVLGMMTLPIETDLYAPGWTPSVTVAAAWDAGAGGVGANLGYTHTEDPGTRELVGSAAYGLPVGSSLAAFVEVFGMLPRDDGLQASADAGLTYLVTPELQLDLRVVRSLRGPDATAFGVGVVHRF
jgi:hypothetical protein